ncbi:hypothetical protein [Methanobrevibacter sp.]|nr:hypothetical protein [uncultured Methanobrevibacter sp.]
MNIICIESLVLTHLNIGYYIHINFSIKLDKKLVRQKRGLYS